MSGKQGRDLIDVSETYFGISIDTAKLFRVGCDDMDCNKRNKTIMKREAISLLEKTNGSQSDQIQYCSVNAVTAKQIKDYYGTEIFPEVEANLTGWFFFIDEMPFANWKHDCKYFFIVDDELLLSKSHTIGVSDSVLMEKI